MTPWVLSLITVILCPPHSISAATLPHPVSFAWNANPEPDVAGYKLHLGDASGTYNQVVDVGNDLAISIDTLQSDTTYFCAVTAYNSAGLESPYSQEVVLSTGSVPVDPDGSGRLVLLEAEDGELGSPMTAYSGPAESWVDSSEISQDGTADLAYGINKSGVYQVWCRVKAPSSSMDSFFVTMDGGTEEVFHVYGTPEPPAGTRTPEWTWKKIHLADGGPRSYTLAEGGHLLRFRTREPGTLLDRVVISSDPAFVPTDSLPRSGDALVITSSPAAQTRAPGQSISLAVTAAATGPVAYQWQKDGTEIPGADTAVLTLENLEIADGGTYSVSLVSGSATATTSPASLTVAEVTPGSEFRVSQLTLNPDLTVSFRIEGGAGANIQVFASSDLQTWAPLGSQANDSGIIRIADPEREGETQRFYRLESPDSN